MTVCHLQEVPDEVDGLRGDLLPGVRWIHEGRVLDLLPDVLVLVERERAGKTHLQRKFVAVALMVAMPEPTEIKVLTLTA